MKIYTTIKTALILLFSISTSVLYAQTKKPVTTKPATPVTKNLGGPLKPEDYKYYFLAFRKSANQPNYTLKDPDYKHVQESIVIDIRDMKEVGFWPTNVKTYISEDNQQLFDLSGRGYFYAYTNTGVFQYLTSLKASSQPILGIPTYLNLFLSTDFKALAYAFNKDIWIASFDTKTGKASSPKQVTFFGPVDGLDPGNIYFNNKYMFADSYSINLLSGKFKSYIYRETNGKAMTKVDWSSGPGGNVFSYPVAVGLPGNLYPDFQEYPLLDKDEIILAFLNKDNTKAYIQSNGQGEGKVQDRIVDFKDGKIIKSNYIDWKWEFVRDRVSIRPNVYTSLNGTKLVSSSYSSDSVSIFDVSSLTKKKLPLKTDVFQHNSWLSWVDDRRFLFNGKMGDYVNGEEITAQNQGTYWFDSATNESKLLTPYFLDIIDLNSQPLNRSYNAVITLPETDRFVFQANNFLFTAKLDGTDVKQVTKTPNTYHLHKHFIDDRLPLNTPLPRGWL